MAIKKSNEITMKVMATKEALIQNLVEKGFKKTENFSLDDYYFIPRELDIGNISVRDILIEVETNSNYDTVDKLKTAVSELKLPVLPNQYFIKKAEVELEKVLNG